MKPTREEMETIIRIGRMNDKAVISTTDSVHMTKLDKLVKINPDEWKFTGQETCQGDVVEKFYECPVNLISFRTKTATGREMTEEQKKASAERLRRYRESQDGKI
jgi:hypothetical protein